MKVVEKLRYVAVSETVHKYVARLQHTNWVQRIYIDVSITFEIKPTGLVVKYQSTQYTYHKETNHYSINIIHGENSWDVLPKEVTLEMLW